MGKSALTKKVITFQQSGQGEEKLIQEIALYIYSSFPVKTYLSKDQRGDFICSVYNEIGRIMNRFSFKGKPFEAYLNIILKWRIKSYLSRTAMKKDIISITNDAHFIYTAQLKSPDEHKQGIEIDDEIASVIRNDTDRKRLLFIFMKEYITADPAYLPYVAQLTGYSERWIMDKAEILRHIVYRRIDRYKKLSEKRNKTFFKLYLAEKKQYEAYTEEEKKAYAVEAKMLKERLHRTNRDLSKFPFYPTHREISAVIGIPKGTIDSGLFYLKKSFYCSHKDSGKAA